MEIKNTFSYEEPHVPGNLLLEIWTKPTATLKYVLANCPDKYLIPLYILGGIHSSIDRAISKDKDLFRSEWSNTEWWYIISFIGFGLVELALGIWSLIIFVKGIMILQGFGAGKALLNAFIPVFLLIGVVLVIVLIVVIFCTDTRISTL